MNKKKKILIVNWDLELGGVERSLISMLKNFDYQKYDVSLYLHSHKGPLLGEVPSQVNLLDEEPSSTTFSKSIKDTFTSGFFALALIRLYVKAKLYTTGRLGALADSGYLQGGMNWKYSCKFLPKIEEVYDLAISYSAEHDFVINNVTAKKKLAWIHTDYSTIHLDKNHDFKIWSKYDHIASISDSCTSAFLKTYPSLGDKIILIENLNDPDYVKEMSQSTIEYNYSGGFNIVSVGRLCEQKAFDRAIDVLSELDKRGYKDINWYVVGDGIEWNRLQNKVRTLGLDNRFVLLGSCTNPYPYMRKADIYVQPSRYEGKAVTVNEALILGKATIITNYPTSNSQITDRVNGLICPQSINGICEYIEKLYSDQKLRYELEEYNKNYDYSNKDELLKLYKVL